MARKTTKSYPESFRREAVGLADAPDRTAADVARKLNIHVGQIYNWRNQFNKLSKGQFVVADSTNYSKEETAEIGRLKTEVAALKQERDFLKKLRRTSLKTARKYALVDSYRGVYTATLMCRVLALTRSGYYAWRTRSQSPCAAGRQAVIAAVIQTFKAFYSRYGEPRLPVGLNARAIQCSLNFVATLLREQGLRARNGKGYRYRPRTQVKEKRLGRGVTAAVPNRKWESDNTYIKAGRVRVYLAAILDLYSRKIVGWSIDTNMREA